jgi:glycosyltransferase involved in cell wall biosynthesis
VLDLLEAFKEVRKEIPTVRLWLAGDGDARGELEVTIQRDNLSDSVWLSGGMLPMDEICELLGQAHVGVVPNQPNALNQYALSTKLFEYVATGIPVVCAGLPTLRGHFSDEELLFFRPGDVGDLAEKLLWSAQQSGDMLERAERAYRRYDAQYSWPQQKATFLRILNSLPAMRVDR